MDLLSSAWDCVSNKENREKLEFIGGGLAAAIATAWAAYVHFSKKPKESSTLNLYQVSESLTPEAD
ncbi:MAG: hypothetical protein WA624_14720, partial [Methylocella sp.]